LSTLRRAAALSLALVACGGAAEQWAALEAEGLPGGAEDAPPTDIERDEMPSLGPEGRDVVPMSDRRPARAEPPPVSARIEANDAPSTPRRLDHRVSFVSWKAERVEARLMAARVRERHAGLVACAREASAGTGFLWVGLRYDKGAKSPEVRSFGDLGRPLGPCVEKLFGDLELDAASTAKAELVVAMRISPPSEVDPKLPEISESEELVLEDGGHCVAREKFTCKPPAACGATTEREIRCPDDHGLAPMLEPGDANERFELVVSGGKAGQGTQTLVYAQSAERCSLTRIIDEPALTPPERARETVDASCSAFAEARALFESKLAGKKFEGSANPHPVGHAVSHWRRRKGGEAPVSRTTQWSGPDPRADASFEALRKLAVAAAKGAGKLRSSRLDD
jgi:hypothetical protein